MQTSMRTWLPLFAVLCGSCEEESDPAFLETEYVRYVTDQPFVPCGGLAQNTDQKVEQLSDRVGEPYPSPQSILYKWVADNSTLVCAENALGCTRLEPEGPIVAALELAVFHELAHAVHFASLGYTHPVLSEGFAVYHGNLYGGLSSSSMDTFASDIESMIQNGDVSAGQYLSAGHFVGAIVERHGIAAFKDFWRELGYSSTLDDFRTAYEAHFDEPWAEALVTIANHERTVWSDLECEGEAQVVGAEGLHLMVAETCEDESVVGPVRNGGGYAGELRIPIELPVEGSYRFAFVHPGGAGVLAAMFRGCQSGGPAPAAPLTAFTAQDDQVVFMAAGRYLLGVRVPLTAGEAPVEVRITREG